MKRFILLLLMSCHLLPAQVSLVIEDETKQGFFLGINGFLQNQEKTKGLLITGLDTVPYILQIDADTVNFQKPIHLRENTRHQYVLTRDFYGDLKLRYRGTMSVAPAGISSTSFSKKTTWPEEWVRNPEVVKEPEVVEPASIELAYEKAAGTDDADTVQAVTVQVPEPKPDSHEVLLAGEDTVTQADAEHLISEPVFEQRDFSTFLKELSSTDFEFEKLQQSLSYVEDNKLLAEEVKQIFAVLKYDQTRLQFLEAARLQVIDPHNLKNLMSALEYEISKQRFNEIIDEKK